MKKIAKRVSGSTKADENMINAYRHIILSMEEVYDLGLGDSS